MVCALFDQSGVRRAAHGPCATPRYDRGALAIQRSGLRRNDFGRDPLPTFIGRVAGVEDAPLPAGHAEWECRNNRLAWVGLDADGFLAAARAARPIWRCRRRWKARAKRQ